MARQMTAERKAYLSALGKARFAALPRDGSCRKCETPIVKDYVFCRDCWLGLSDESRAAINAAFVPGIHPADQTGADYWAAVEAAR
jgi:hypothetical protein